MVLRQDPSTSSSPAAPTAASTRSGQVVSYDGPLPLLRSVNALLPDEVAVLAAEEMPDGFSARHDAVSRSYVYRVLARRTPSPFERGRALWWPHAVDLDALQACAAALARHPRLHRLHAGRDLPPRFHRHVLAASWTRERATCWRSGSRPTASCAR